MLFPRLLPVLREATPEPCLSPLCLLSFSVRSFFPGIHHNRQVPCFFICSQSVSSKRCRSHKSKYSVLCIFHILCAPNQRAGKCVPSCWVFLQKGDKSAFEGIGGRPSFMGQRCFSCSHRSLKIILRETRKVNKKHTHMQANEFIYNLSE